MSVRISTRLPIMRRCKLAEIKNHPRYGLIGIAAALLLILLAGGFRHLFAQQKIARPQKLPSAQKIVDDYLKAMGGKKRLALIRDATYEWTIQLDEQPMGVARTQLKSPGSLRSEMTFGNGQIISAASMRSAWVHGLDGQLRTLTGTEGATAKLQALLAAGHLVDLKKLNVLSRSISVGDLASEPAYIVEFSTRNGARLRYWFSVSSKMLLKIEDNERKTTTRFKDYRPQRTSEGVLEPHRVSLSTGPAGELAFLLQRASYNTGIGDSTFDPPGAAQTLDLRTLLLEVGRNQDEVERRVSEYAFVEKETDQEITSKGEIKKEKVKVFEIFPIPHSEPIRKLISENGVPLSPERAAKETKRVEEEFLKAERDRDKTEQKVERRREEQRRKYEAEGKTQDEDPELSQFVRICEFVSPRRERFRHRDAVVFDFRARPGFKPRSREESLISKLVGVVWIDPEDKQIMRLEARLAENFKLAAGLVSLRPGASFAIEQTRMAEGVWLPRSAQINLATKILMFGGPEINKIFEWSDYKHFKGDVGDYKLETPKTVEPEKKP